MKFLTDRRASRDADLETADDSAKAIGKHARLGDRIHVQSHEELFHHASTVPTRSLRRSTW